MKSAEPEAAHAKFRPNQTYDIRTEDSQLVHFLSGAAWIPDKSGVFRKPQELTKEEPTIWDGSRKNLLDVLDQAKEEKDSLQQLVEVINQAGEKQDDKKALNDAVSSLLETTTTPTTSTIMNGTTSTTTSTVKEQ